MSEGEGAIEVATARVFVLTRIRFIDRFDWKDKWKILNAHHILQVRTIFPFVVYHFSI